MSALAELRKRAVPAATRATPATFPVLRSQESQKSPESQGVNVDPHFSETRRHLLALADRDGIDPAHIHRLHALDVAVCEGLNDAQLTTYLHLLDDTATRWAGKVPRGHTAAIHCGHCGPVWAHPDVAAVLPVVNGWPRALGCPWCLVRQAGKYVPRPPVTCERCVHFVADTLQPGAGVGRCGQGHGMYYPMATHRCAAFQSDATA